MDRYAPLIMHAVQQFEYQNERANDCFLHVCEQLCVERFQRLLKFNTDGPASFSTWLGAVVFNLCVDWHRAEYGRVQMLPAVGALPAFDQALYHLQFEQGLGRQDCYRTLRQEFPGLTQAQFADAAARVHSVLTPRQRWRLTVKRWRRQGALEDIDNLVADAASPAETVASAQNAAQLRAALAALEPEDRLILHLRFTEGLTLKQLAAAMNLGDLNRADRQLRAALAALAARLPGTCRDYFP
jgi:RNA polymerase sigma factor (sigma-70 family)